MPSLPAGWNCSKHNGKWLLDIITKNFVWDMIIFFRYPALFLFTVAILRGPSNCLACSVQAPTQKKNALANEKISILLHKKFFVIMSIGVDVTIWKKKGGAQEWTQPFSIMF